MTKIPATTHAHYEPEEYPRCQNCGRLAPHPQSALCSLCPTPEKPSPLSHFTASDFAPPKR